MSAQPERTHHRQEFCRVHLHLDEGVGGCSRRGQRGHLEQGDSSHDRLSRTGAALPSRARSRHQRIVAVPGLLRSAAGPSDTRPSEHPDPSPKPPRLTAREHPRRHLARTRRGPGNPTVAYPCAPGSGEPTVNFAPNGSVTSAVRPYGMSVGSSAVPRRPALRRRPRRYRRPGKACPRRTPRRTGRPRRHLSRDRPVCVER